jgi:hypothetical protein
MEVRDTQLTSHTRGHISIKPREQSQKLQIHAQARQEMSYSAVGLVFPFPFLIIYSLDYVPDLHRNFIT